MNSVLIIDDDKELCALMKKCVEPVSYTHLHVASNPILVFSIEFAAIIQMFPQLIHSAAL